MAEWHRKAELMQRYLSDEDVRVLQSHCDEALKHYVILSNWAVAAKELLFPNQAKITCNSAAIYGLFPHVITRLQLASCFC